MAGIVPKDVRKWPSASSDSTEIPRKKLLEQEKRKQLAKPDEKPQEVVIPVFPWSAALCTGCSVVIASATIVVVALGGISERYYYHSPDVAWHSRSSIVLVIQAGLMELCILISSSIATGIAGPELRPKPQSDDVLQAHNFGDSVLTLLEYALKFVTSCYLSQKEGVVMHVNKLVPGSRPVYLIRFVQWAFAVPLLMLLSNRAFLAKHGEKLTWRRSAPGMVLSMFYCMASWVLEVTPLNWARWSLMLMVLTSFILCCIDQVCLALSVHDVTARRMKLGMLIYQLVSFAVYTCIYVSSYFACINATTEQNLYSYMDATVKVFQSCLLAMIRNYEDLRIMQHWWLESVAARRDFERLVKQARVPIFALDRQGHVTSWNENVANLTGLAANEVIGLKTEDIICKESRECVQHALSRALSAAMQESAPGPVEIWVKRAIDDKVLQDAAQRGKKPEMKPINLVVSFVPRITREGAVDGIVAIGQDLSEISELKAVEQKKVQLMAVVSHELRSPLHGMIGLTNMLEQQIDGVGFKRQLKMVRCCAQRLLDLVTNIMDLTEAEQRQRRGVADGKHKGLVNMLDVAEEVTMMTSMAMDKSGKPLVGPGLKLVNAMGELQDFPLVLGNPYKCAQLLYNLVTNACKFTSKGSVTLCARHVKEAGLLEVDVEDTGMGIPEEAQQRIFQPFEQEQTSLADSRNYQGMGLGLTVCFEIAKTHGGSIRVRSKVGVGSTFTVSLPCEDTFVNRNREDENLIASLTNHNEAWAFKQACAKQKATEQSQSQVPNLRLSPRTANGPTEDKAPSARRRPIILSVDDDEINQEAIKSALGTEGDVVRAMNGNEALDHLERCTKADTSTLPDVILLDIQMPGIAGFDVLSQVRQKYSSAHTTLPVIMISAKAPVEAATLRSYSDGCSDFLPKPFHAGLLKAKIAVSLKIKEELRESCRASEILAETARVAHESAKASSESGALKEVKERLEQAEAKAQKAGEESHRAAEEAAAAKRGAKAAEERAAAMEEELTRLRRALEQSQAAEAAAVRRAEAAAAEKVAEARPAAAEEELRELRRELQEARADRAAALQRAASVKAENAGSPPVDCRGRVREPAAAFEGAGAEAAHIRSTSAGSWVAERSSASLPPRQQPEARPSSVPAQPPSPQRHPLPETQPPLAGFGNLSSHSHGVLVPWLYQQLQEREDEIVNLNGQLAAHRSATELATRQMELVMQAAEHSQCILLGPEEDHLYSSSSRPLSSK